MAGSPRLHACRLEATGVYWRPVWHMLEGQFELVLANAQHIKNVPGRKILDVNDAVWIADLLAHGLIRSSFVPPAPIQELRDLTRTRKQLGARDRPALAAHPEGAGGRQHQARQRAVRRADRLRQEPSCGPSSAAKSDPERLADLAQGTARRKRLDLIEALRGRVTAHHCMMLKLHLDLIADLERALGEVDAAVGKALAPIRERARLLTTMPGISDLVAQVVVAEISVDMARFPTAGHLISWAGLCPRNDESAGQAPLHACAQERHLVEAHAGHRRLGRRARQGQLLACPVAPQSTSRRKEGDPGRCRFDAHRSLHQAPRRRPLSRRSAPLRPTPARHHHPAAHPQTS